MHVILPFILAVSLFTPVSMEAKVVAGSVTQTAANSDGANVNGGYLWLRGTDGRDHRAASDNAGNAFVSVSPGVQTGSGPITDYTQRVIGVAYSSVTNVAFAATSHTVLTIGPISFTAGAVGPWEVGWNPAQGGSAIRVMDHNSLATAPTAAQLSTTYGAYIPTTPSATQIFGYYTDSMFFSVIGIGATVSGTVQLRK